MTRKEHKKLDLLIALLLIMIGLHTFFVPVRITGNSMINFARDGEIKFYSRMYRKISRGDIIVFCEPELRCISVKRVMYISGDEYWINMFNANEVFYSDKEDMSYEFRIKQIVSKGNLFVIGDSEASVDSRTYGYVETKDVIGKVW